MLVDLKISYNKSNERPNERTLERERVIRLYKYNLWLF